MKYISTRGGIAPLSFEDAVISGNIFCWKKIKEKIISLSLIILLDHYFYLYLLSFIIIPISPHSHFFYFPRCSCDGNGWRYLVLKVHCLCLLLVRTYSRIAYVTKELSLVVLVCRQMTSCINTRTVEMFESQPVHFVHPWTTQLVTIRAIFESKITTKSPQA